VSDEEEGTVSASATPVKHIGKKGKSAGKKQKLVQLEDIHEDDKMVNPDTTEEEMEPEAHEVYPGNTNHLAEQHLYDPSTPFKCPTKAVLRHTEAFWIGAHNSQVNTPESDAPLNTKSKQSHSSGKSDYPLSS